jgi:hypothetical protein
MATLRSDWFAWVNKTRKRMSRGAKELVPHRTAMKAASITWPKEKEKILKKRRRESKKQEKAKTNKKARVNPEPVEQKSTE